MNKLFFGIIALMFVSCNQSDKIIKESLRVEIDLAIYKNDTIQLFYTVNTDDAYTGELNVKQFVEGKNELQKLNYKLPVGVKPKNIRIDLGEQEQYHDSIRIQSIIFKYRDLILDGSDGKYKKWFVANKSIYFEKDSLTLRFTNKYEDFDPQLNGNKKLNKSLVKLFPPDVNER